MTKTDDAPAAEPKIVLLRLDQIRRHGGTQSRAALNSATAARYAEDMRNGDQFPELVVFHGVDDRETSTDRALSYWLGGGFHRYEAYDQIGEKAVFCKVYEGGIRDAILFSVGENHKSLLERSPQDKRFSVKLLLNDREWWRKTDSWVAEKCHVSHPLVARVRAEMIAEQELEQARRAEKQASPDPVETQPGAASLVETFQVRTEQPDPANQPSTDKQSSLEPVSSDNPPPPAPDTRLGRSRHGGERPLSTGNIGKNGNAKVKPVVLETEIGEIAKKMVQLVRSIPKAIRQAKAIGWSWEKYLEENRKGWEEIPVASE